MIQMFLCMGDKYRRYRCRPTYNTIKPPHLVAACLS